MLQYHEGQIELQNEANTRDVADMLAGWSGPVGEFCRTADMIVIAVANTDARLSFLILSGAPPIIKPLGEAQVLLEGIGLEAAASGEDEVPFGAIGIDLSTARRVRLNGVMRRTPQGLLLIANESFTNCRKYIAPSEPLAKRRHLGPVDRMAVGLEDSQVGSVLARAETAFLATRAPDGTIDVSHRGGPQQFLTLDPANSDLSWDEYVGDGMFKSAGNIRATGVMSLLVLDLPTGDGLEFQGHARVTISRRDKTPRADVLLQQREKFPVQGAVICRIQAASVLRGITHPRRRLQKRQRVTSASALEEQYPQ